MDTRIAANPSARLSTIQQSFLFLLRVVIGWHFLYEGFAKLVNPEWSAAGYLEVSRWLFSGFFQWIAHTPTALQAVDFLVVWGMILIGMGLMVGLFTRIAGASGMLLLLFFYLCNPPLVGLGLGIPTEGNYLVVDKNVVELFALAALLVFPSRSVWGLDWWLARRKTAAPDAQTPKVTEEPQNEVLPQESLWQRDMIKGLAGLPFLGALALAVARKEQWKSYEAKNLVEAVTSASSKALRIASLEELDGQLPMGQIQGLRMSRMILGGNLLSGWAHSRDLIYVSQLVKAYHTKDRIFATLLLAEKCGINTLLTNPILCTLIDEYWKRGIGKMQFISDCAGLEYDSNGPHPMPFQEYLDRIKRAIDYGASACYIQGETADYYTRVGQPEYIEKALELIRQNGVVAGIGAHDIQTVKSCVELGLTADFWMKTLHHHNYWSAKHPEWNDNVFCKTPDETIEFMKTRKEPWIAFKVLAAGAIRPADGFRYAVENGADFLCVGMYDFQMVQNVNEAALAFNSDIKRERPWMGELNV